MTNSSWANLRWWNSREWEALKGILDSWEEGKDFVPSRRDIFRALVLCPLDRVRVIILGQDPYPVPGMADGLAFSSREKKIPASLKNIFNEYCTDLGYIFPKAPDLSPWAREGVLLWNTYATVSPKGGPESHKNIGWENLTREILDAAFDETGGNVVFIAWGKHAQRTVTEMNFNHPTVIASPHPSPLAAYDGFFGSRPFSRCNSCLRASGLDPIYWNLN